MTAKSFKVMATDHITCRSINHSWIHQASFVMPESFVELHFLCTRCKCTRKDVWSRAGEVESRSYSHPRDYLVENLKKGWGGRAVFNQNVRAELITRVAKNAPRKKR